MLGADERAAILDPVFFCDKISIGPLFHVISAARGREANEIFGAFGLAFENYANDILKRMYPTRPFLASRLSCNVPIGRFEIDAVLNDVSQLVLFEMKAAWLPEGPILDDSHERFVESLRARYGIAVGDDERPKGVAQLARATNLIFGFNAADSSGQFAAAQKIYPVLVVHDVNLNAPITGHFLNNEFRALLNTFPIGKNVAPLTLMTISDLEVLEASVDNFALRDLLADYAREHPDRMVSLQNFIVRSRYGDLLAPNTALINKSEEFLQATIRNLFPNFVGPA